MKRYYEVIPMSHNQKHFKYKRYRTLYDAKNACLCYYHSTSAIRFFVLCINLVIEHDDGDISRFDVAQPRRNSYRNLWVTYENRI